MPTPIAIGSDEAGFDLKAVIVELLEGRELQVTDFGCDSPDPVDDPDVACAGAGRRAG